MSTKLITRKFDLNLRHKSGMTSDQFIKEYCEVFRGHAVATQDSSLNEFEKLITHVLAMKEYYKRAAHILGLPKATDPRDLVWAVEDTEEHIRTKAELDLTEAIRGIVRAFTQQAEEQSTD